MDVNINTENEDKLLQEWVVSAPLPLGFQERVWSRIARAEAPAQPSFWAGLMGALATSLSRPRVAWSSAAVLLALGIAAGSFTAAVKSSRMESDLGQMYLLSVSPYQQAMAGP